MSLPRVVPWASLAEWSEVRAGLYSVDEAERSDAIKMVRALGPSHSSAFPVENAGGSVAKSRAGAARRGDHRVSP
jgi:hypothetical protein